MQSQRRCDGRRGAGLDLDCIPTCSCAPWPHHHQGGTGQNLFAVPCCARDWAAAALDPDLHLQQRK